MRLQAIKPPYSDQVREVAFHGHQNWLMLKSEKFQVEKGGTSTKSRLELKMALRKKAAQVSEDMEEALIHGKCLKENTSTKFYTDKELGLMVSLL